MELGEVYKENGEIAFDKLFYFHFRTIPNHLFYYDIDGCAIVQLISEKHKASIKEVKEDWCYVLDKNINILVEKTIVLNTQEIITGNGYCLTYYYGEKRVLDEDTLRELAFKYSNKSSSDNTLF